jgi:predicted nuclease of restriction endonuclease-like (RecB) superfamily
MRLFYVTFPKIQTLSGQLSWSHIVEFLKINDALKREFYEKQTVLENWSVRESQRQKESGLFLRLGTSKSKQEILELSKNGQLRGVNGVL